MVFVVFVMPIRMAFAMFLLMFTAITIIIIFFFITYSSAASRWLARFGYYLAYYGTTRTAYASTDDAASAAAYFLPDYSTSCATGRTTDHRTGTCITFSGCSGTHTTANGTADYLPSLAADYTANRRTCGCPQATTNGCFTVAIVSQYIQANA
jgi:hypothetical protein